MNWFTKFLFVAALVAVISVTAMVSRQTRSSPQEVLDEVLVQLGSDAYDELLVLRKLENGIRRAELLDPNLPGIRELCADLRLTRAKLLMDMGAYTDARTDLELVLERYRQGDSEVRRMLVEIDSADGELERALERLEKLLKDEPRFGPAWVESGRMHQRLADQALDHAKARLHFALITEDAKLAEERLDSLAARASSDPLRTNDILALRELFSTSDEETLAQVLELCELANEELQLAREGYLRSFQFDIYPLAVHGYLKILLAAEQDAATIALGSLLSSKHREPTDPEVAELLIRTLAKHADWPHASFLAGSWVRSKQPLSAEFLRLICYCIYKGESWSMLFGAANRLRAVGTTDDELLSAFYRGFGYANSKKPKADLALRSLEIYARGRSSEPFEGARAVAWKRISELYAEAGDLNREREALQAVLALDPDFSAELWIRRAEIQLHSRHSGYQLPLNSWAKGMSLAPRRTEELLPTFLELGEKALASQDRDITLIYGDVVRSGLTVPQRNYGPYVLLLLAREHGRRGKPAAQAAVARKLLNELPGFLPAHDELIAASVADGNRREFVELVVQRAELAGLSERTLELLSSISADEYLPGQVVRMMQADTRGTGRVVVAEWLYKHGRAQEALKTLRIDGDALRSEQELLLGAHIEIEDGNYAQAMKWLDQLPKSGARVRERRLQTLICALQLRDRKRIREIATEIFKREAPSTAETLKLADVFLRLQETQGALTILEGLEGSPGVPPGPIIFRRSLALLARGDLAAAEVEIDRCESFLPEAQGAILRLLLEGQRADWTACARTAEQLFELAPPEDPELAALLYLLMGEEQEALELADFALEFAPQSLVWTLTASIARLRSGQPLSVASDFGVRGIVQTQRFLTGAPDESIDPRQVVPLLLAAELPAFHPYLQAELRSIDSQQRGKLWPRLLEANLLALMQLSGEARPVLEQLAATFPDCLPAWEELEWVLTEQLGSPDHPRVLAVRKNRIEIMAKAYPDGLEAVLLEAAEAMHQGNLGPALRLTQRVVDERPDWFPARVQLAQIQTEMRHWTEAREAWTWATGHEDERRGRRAVAGFIDMLARAAADDEHFTQEQQRSELTLLEQVHPDDPRPPLALARLDLTLDAANPAIGVSRALVRLRSFREQHKGLSLEELQRGSTKEWAEFFVEASPGAAEDFLRAELELQPGDLELWRLLGRVLRELGDLEASTDFLMRAARMAPDTALRLEIARTLVVGGAETRMVAKILRGITGTREEELDAQLLNIESMLSQYIPRMWQVAVTKLKPLWDSRTDLDKADERARLALIYARALLLRGEVDDPQTAEQALLSHLRYADKLYQLEYMQALIGIARSLSASPE